MSSRRLEKVSRVVQSTVSEVLQSRISDPRVRGLISVTRVELSADLRIARVHLSILGLEETQQELCFKGICYARGFIRSCLSNRLTMKTCPSLNFYLDGSLKQSLKTMQIIDQVSAESAKRQESQGALTEGDNEEGVREDR